MKNISWMPLIIPLVVLTLPQPSIGAEEFSAKSVQLTTPASATDIAPRQPVPPNHSVEIKCNDKSKFTIECRQLKSLREQMKTRQAQNKGDNRPPPLPGKARGNSVDIPEIGGR